MSLTAIQVGIFVSNRLGVPAFERPRLQTLIDAGLETLAQRVANDTTKRHLLLTDRSSITASITNSNQDYYANLATIQSTNAVMLDYLQYGTVYHTYATTTFTGANVDTNTDTAAVSGNIYPTGLKVRLTTSGSLPTGLSLLTDYYLIDASATHGTGALQFATSRANALSGTAVNLTGTGSGTHTITPWEQETVQWLNREGGDLARSLPLNYIYGWLVDTKLFTNALGGTFSFTVPYVPTLSNLPGKLEQEFLDCVVELAQRGDTDDE